MPGGLEVNRSTKYRVPRLRRVASRGETAWVDGREGVGDIVPNRRLAGFLALAILVIGAGCTAGPAGPAGSSASSKSPSDASSGTASAPTPKRVASAPAAALPTRSPSPSPLPVPVESSVDGVTVRTLQDGPLLAPIDVAVAFGSVWVADHHGPTVTRVDPKTMTIEAVVATGSGPGWFAVTDDAVWVSNQNGRGMTRIDPATNATEMTGRWATCGRPTVAFGSIWQPACDAHRIMRIDPVTTASVDIAAPGHTSVIRAGTALVAGGPNGLARLDPKTFAFTEIGGQDPGWLLAFDGRTIWSSTESVVLRIDPRDGRVLATLDIPDAGAVVFRDGVAWLTSSGGLVAVDMKTNRTVRTVALGRTASMASDETGLWATSYDANSLMWVRP